MDGGPYTLWLAGTPDTSAYYTGAGIKTHSFYSVAIDNVGNREAAPGTADAQTTLLDQYFDGTAGDDTFNFVAGPTYDSWTIEINGAARAIDPRATGVHFDGLGGADTVTFTGTAGDGADVASLYDSPGDDTLVTGPDSVQFSGTGFSQTVTNFPTVHTYATAGATAEHSFTST